MNAQSDPLTRVTLDLTKDEYDLLCLLSKNKRNTKVAIIRCLLKIGGLIDQEVVFLSNKKNCSGKIDSRLFF